MEVLVVACIATVGLTAIAAGLQIGVGAVEVGRIQTTALFLAEEKLEELRAAAAMTFESVAAGTFATEDPVAGYSAYRREVRVTPDPAGAANAVQIHVTVSYGAGRDRLEQSSVTLMTVVSRR